MPEKVDTARPGFFGRLVKPVMEIFGLSRLVAFLPAEHRERLLSRLDEIEQAVNHMKVPASFGDQFYALRGDIAFVRDRVKQTG